MNSEPLGHNEIMVKTAHAFGKNCIGCRRYDADVMVSFILQSRAPTKQFCDAYMDRAQAEQLLVDLIAILARRDQTEASTK